MNVTREWWAANHICSGRNYEDLEEIKGTFLTHVASVRVLPPFRRHDLRCHIYGEVSFNVAGDTRDFVTLYSRDRDTAEFFDLADDDGHGSCLTLSDRHESERPLLKVEYSKPLLFKIKLYEAMGGLMGKDTLIADIDGKNSGCMKNLSNYFEVDGESGFRFELGYSVVFGARVEIGVKITNRERFPDRRIPMWGYIEAYQYLEDLDYSTDGETVTLMRIIDKTEPVTFKVGDRIELLRRFVVAPLVYTTYLCVRIAPLIDKEDRVVYHDVNFPLTPEHCLTAHGHASFWTNRKMTHSKDIRHNGIVFSVSITFVPPEENEHVPKIPASTKWRKLQRPEK